jgi:hypothetical protein
MESESDHIKFVEDLIKKYDNTILFMVSRCNSKYFYDNNNQEMEK